MTAVIDYRADKAPGPVVGEGFHLPESKRAITSQIFASTIEAGLIKPDEKAGSPRKCARYLPFWA